MRKKEIVLKRLQNTYCRLQPSKISGVGVFAIRDIPKGVNPFYGTTEPKWIKFKLSELKNLDKEVLRMIDDFNVIEEDETVFIPVCALNGMDISSFLNNSNSPNLITNEGGSTFITARRIKKGEELTTSYETFDYKYREL